MDEILHQLLTAKKTKNAILLEEALYLYDDGNYSALHTDILCQLLQEHWHDRHEDIIMTLEVIKDPRSVEDIYTTSLSILEWDDGRSLAKNCVWTLMAINTSESIGKVKLLAQSDDRIIKEWAELNLRA